MAVDTLDVFVVLKMAYHLVFGLAMFHCRKSETDWSQFKEFNLQKLVVNTGNEQIITLLPMGDGCVEGSACQPPPPAVDTQFLEGTTLDDPLAITEVLHPSQYELGREPVC